MRGNSAQPSRQPRLQWGLDLANPCLFGGELADGRYGRRWLRLAGHGRQYWAKQSASGDSRPRLPEASRQDQPDLEADWHVEHVPL
jgi:hypothetical protein